MRWSARSVVAIPPQAFISPPCRLLATGEPEPIICSSSAAFAYARRLIRHDGVLDDPVSQNEELGPSQFPLAAAFRNRLLRH